jgi:predicted dithiol-disulfide oxidoreductase (DUF899 family)
MEKHKVVSREQWLEARRDLLAKEKEITRLRDALTTERRSLPWVRVAKEYGRGGEQFLGIYGFFDVMPKGRNENGPYHSLGDWARPRNMYGQGGMVEPNGRYHAPACGCGRHDNSVPIQAVPQR